jgi:transglutaminase-like putative cysteine protease
MTSEDRKKLEEIKCAIEPNAEDTWLISQLESEAAEVERLQDEVTRTKDNALAMQRHLKERTDRAETELATMTGNAEVERLARVAAEARVAELEARVKELEGFVRLMISTIPEGWTVPLLCNEIVAQLRAARLMAEEAK